jgi:protein pelota
VNVSATGSTDSNRVRTTLTIEVKRVHFSPSASGAENAGAGAASASTASADQLPTASLHIAGPVTEENQHVKMGAYHTLDIETQRDIRIIKEEWDSVALERVEEAIVPGRGAEVGAVVCGEGARCFALSNSYAKIVSF